LQAVPRWIAVRHGICDADAVPSRHVLVGKHVAVHRLPERLLLEFIRDSVLAVHAGPLLSDKLDITVGDGVQYVRQGHILC
jgi:hypothetical protein